MSLERLLTKISEDHDLLVRLKVGSDGLCDVALETDDMGLFASEECISLKEVKEWLTEMLETLS